MQRSGVLLQPLINLIHDKVLEQKYLHMDETIVQVLNEPNKTAQSQSYMWVLRSTLPTCAAVLFQYEPTRSGSVPSFLLREFNGTLMVDGYSGYNFVCEQNKITRLGCSVTAPALLYLLHPCSRGRMYVGNLSTHKTINPKEKSERPIKV